VRVRQYFVIVLFVDGLYTFSSATQTDQHAVVYMGGRAYWSGTVTQPFCFVLVGKAYSSSYQFFARNLVFK